MPDIRNIAIWLLLALAVAGWGAGCVERTRAADLAGQVNDARQQRDSALEQRNGARAAASACSDAMEDLRTLADQRVGEAAAARTASAGRAEQHNLRADQILSMPPPVPGNACASAQVRIDDWLKGRPAP